MDGEREALVDEKFLRACACEEEVFPVVIAHELAYDADLAQLQEFVRLVRRQGNKYCWRRLMARRTSAFATILRRIEQALGDRFAGRGRELAGTAWNIVAYGDDGELRTVARVSAPRPRTIADLCEPILVEILEPMMVPRTAVESTRLRGKFIEGAAGSH